jgi:hypothetical protein
LRRYAILPLALLALAACSKPAEPAADKFADFEPQIVAWRDAIEAESPLCKAKQDGKGCQDFAVACKRERELTAEDQARGVTAKLVAAMNFNARGPDGRPGSAVAEFTKTGKGWTRAETMAVNMATCEAAPAQAPAG